MANLVLLLLACVTVGWVVSNISVFIEIKYKRVKIDDSMLVCVGVFNKIPLYCMKVPIIDFVNKNKIPWAEAKIGRHSESMRISEKTSVKREIKLIRHTLHVYVESYFRFTKHIIESLRCKKLYWHTTCGLDDAALGGLITGLIWCVKGIILHRMDRRLNWINKPHIQVLPAFNDNIFETDFHCIFTIKVGNVISAAIDAISPNLRSRGESTGA